MAPPLAVWLRYDWDTTLVTVIAAYFVLKESLTWAQGSGLVLALIAIYLLSV
jgi:drug/metabolite transporter (DMT)-like permease